MDLVATADCPAKTRGTSVEASTSPLALDALCKRYRGRSGPVQALDQLSLELRPGELMSLVGPNGAGKSTALRIVAGLVRADSGTVTIFGRSHAERGVKARALGGMLDGGRILYPRLTVAENLEYLGVLKGLAIAQARTRSRALLERFGLGARKPEVLQKLSRGLQQQVALIACLVHQPRVLILDEPTLGLDQESQSTVIGLLSEFRNEGMTILLTSHQLELVQRVSSRIAFIRRGAICGVLGRTELDAFANSAPRLAVRYDTAALGARLSRQLPFPVELVAHGSQTDVMVDAGDMYSLLDATRPCPVVSIERTRSALMAAYDAAFHVKARHA